MGVYGGPDLKEDDLVLFLDAANSKNYNLTEVEYLIVAGGGGSTNAESNPAGDGAGGGGGGGVLTGTTSISSQQHTIVVGDGGLAANGENSSAFGLTAIGGGRGGGMRNAGVTSGGSGGGAGGNCNGNNRTGGSGTEGQGNRGGNDLASGCSNRGGVGGGGAGKPGVDANSSNGSNGGDGIISYISGQPSYYAGGGGGGPGGGATGFGVGGLGGGGNGSNRSVIAQNGAPNTGGGGGGGSSGYISGGKGGSGIVIVRYPGPQKAIGGTVTSVGGYTIHTFTTVGSTTFTPLVATNNSAILGLSDFSGNNNFGTSVNGVVYSSANGGSLSFDGSDDYVQGTIPSSTFTGPHSICCWFYRKTVKQWSALFSNNVNTTSCSILTFIDSSNNLGINQVGVDAAAIAIDLGADHLNKWIYAVITFSGVSNGSTVNLYAYKNGSLLTNSGSLYWNMSSSSSYYVGRHWTNYVQIHDGFIPQVSIYNRALTATEIQQNFNALRGRFGI